MLHLEILYFLRWTLGYLVNNQSKCRWNLLEVQQKLHFILLLRFCFKYGGMLMFIPPPNVLDIALHNDYCFVSDLGSDIEILLLEHAVGIKSIRRLRFWKFRVLCDWKTRKWRKFVNFVRHSGQLFIARLMQHISAFPVMQRSTRLMLFQIGISEPSFVITVAGTQLISSVWIIECSCVMDVTGACMAPLHNIRNELSTVTWGALLLKIL